MFQVERKVFLFYIILLILCAMCFLGKTLFYTSRTIYRLFAHNTIHTHALLLFGMLCLTQFIGCGLCPLTRIHNIYTVVQPSATESSSLLLSSIIHSSHFFIPFSSYYDTPYPSYNQI